MLLLAEVKVGLESLTPLEAEAVIAAEMIARQNREAARKSTIEAVPALDEWEVNHGNRKTILRRVIPPILRTRDEAQINSPTGKAWTEEEIAAWVAEQSVPRMLTLTATVYDHTLTEITWRDEAHNEWTVLSNIDFRYLGSIGSFTDKQYAWMTFFFVNKVDSEQEAEIVRRAAEMGFSYTPRTPKRWLSMVPAGFLGSEEPEYLVIANKKEAIPAALYEELDVLHQYYHANEERLIAAYERNKVLNEARRLWHKANPPSDKEERILNFWVPTSLGINKEPDNSRL